MSLTSIYCKLVAQSDALSDKLNMRAEPFGDLVQESLNKSLERAIKRRDISMITALEQAGGQFQPPSPEEQYQEARYLMAAQELAAEAVSRQEVERVLAGDGNLTLNAEDQAFFRGLRISL